MNAQTESYTHLHGRWLLTARLAWAVVFITLTAIYALGFLAAHETLSTICNAGPCSLREQIRHTDAGERVERWPGPPVGYADRLRPDQAKALQTLGLTLDQYAWLGALQLGIPALVLLLIAAGLFWWKSDDWMALFASVMVATFPMHNMPLAFNLALHQPAWDWTQDVVSVVALSCLLIFPLIFPTGQFVPRWTRWMAIYAVIVAVLAAFLGSDILEVFGQILGRVFIGIIVLLPFGIAVYAQLYRYFRVARPAERQQFKWVVVGLAGTLVTQFAVLIPLNALLTSPAFSADPARALVLSAIPDTLWQLNNLIIAVCIVISVLRYRLWDIDVLINRSLVYFTLIAVIAGLYVLVVGSLSSLLQNQNNLAAPLVALLIVAALVVPLRRTLQSNVNRLLHFDPGRRDESQVVLQKTSEPSNEARGENIQAYVIAKEDSSPYTRLQGRWLLIARLGWIAIAALAMIVYLAAAPVAFRQLRAGCDFKPCASTTQIKSEGGKRQPEQVGQSQKFDPWYHTILEAALRLISMGVALLIFWRRSDDWTAYVASIMLVSSFAIFSPSPLMLATVQPLWEWPLAFLRVIALTSAVGLFYLFPDGRFVPRWTRWLAVAFLVYIGILALTGVPFQSGFPLFVVALATGVGLQIYRYRRVSTALQRQQTKWVVLGIAAMLVLMVVFFIFSSLNPSLNPVKNPGPIPPQGAFLFSMMITFCVVIPLCFLPVTLAFSILRYRLWDVDILINRTLVYGMLTASVIGLYVLIVGWSSIGLQTQNNLADSVFAILVIAFLFRPLHQRLQRIADRFVPVPQTASSVEQHAHQIAIPENQGAADTRSRGRWLTLMHAVWVLCAALASLIFLAALSPGYALYFSGGFRVAIDAPAWYVGAARFAQGSVSLFATLVSLVLAGVIFWRKRDDPGALFVSFYLLVYGILFGPLDNFADAPTQSRMLISPDLLRDIQSGVSSILSLLLFYLFPNGRFVPRWTRYAIWPALLVAPTLASLFGSHRVSLKTPLEWSVLGIYTVLVGLGVYAQIYRYRRFATPVEKQQTKTVVFGFMLVLIMNILLAPSYSAISQMPLGVLRPWWAPLRTLAWWISVTIIPVSLTIAIMRYRLWDIDIIINRTLVYGALTGIVVSAFVILVGFLSILFQSSGNSIVAIVATGLIALLFNPLRQRLQRSINHLMYGERDQPYIALSRLGRQLETSLAPEAVLPTVVTTVRDVLKLPYVAIYLQQDSQGYKIVAESASPLLHMENGRIRVPGIEREGRCIPLIHQGETLGYIVLGPRAPNEAFSTTDLHLLEDLAPQVGVAVHAVRLTADLQRSRERLVVAREEERRRLRRDLHDGLGPQLAGLALKLETLRNRLHDDPLADSLLADLAKRTQDATADIRHLVYELRPPTLDELGLVMALQEAMTQFTHQGSNDLTITFDAPERLPPLPAAVEVAAYRIIQEALTNVVRHAEARNCHVELGLDEAAGILQLRVQDDGKGLLLKRRAGVGLNSMRERAEELGGSFAITAVPTGGTLLSVCLPCRADVRSTPQSSQAEA